MLFDRRSFLAGTASFGTVVNASPANPIGDDAALLDLRRSLGPGARLGVMPDPASMVARLTGEGSVATASSAPTARPSGTTARVPSDFEGLVRAVEQSGKHLLAQQLHDQVGLVRYAPPELVLKPGRPLGADWSRDLMLALKSATGASWQVLLSDDTGEPSLLDQEKMAEERVRSDVLADPNVRAVMDAFPDAELESFSTRGS